MAITSLILSLFGCLLVPAIVGMILGIFSLRRISHSAAPLKGKGLAWTGIIISGVTFLLYLSAGVYLGVVNHLNAGKGAIIVAARNGDEASLASLLEKNSQLVDARSGMGFTPLHEAVLNGNHLHSVELLLDHGADINAFVGVSDNPNALDTPVPRIGSKITIPLKQGVTPLMVAIRSDGKDRMPIIELLLSRGADTTLTDTSGNTVMEIARQMGDVQLVALLERFASR